MPIHDWTRVDAGLFHDFHLGWICALNDALNVGGLPPDFFALIENKVHSPIPDLLNMVLSPGPATRSCNEGVLAVATTPPQATIIRHCETDAYARRANRIVIRHRSGEVVAVIEIVSPGTKSNKAEFRTFVKKSVELIRQGVHLLVIDLFPPTKRDRQGIHKAIWDEFADEDLELPADKPLTLASYDAGPEYVAYVNLVGVGDVLPDMPLFLKPEHYVPAPLETTYQPTWNVFPNALKGLLTV